MRGHKKLQLKDLKQEKTKVKSRRLVNRCRFGTCRKNAVTTANLRMYRMLESGRLFDFDSPHGLVNSIRVPFCSYHYELSKHVELALFVQNNEVEVLAPYEEIEIVEAVLNAREAAGRRQC